MEITHDSAVVPLLNSNFAERQDGDSSIYSSVQGLESPLLRSDESLNSAIEEEYEFQSRLHKAAYLVDQALLRRWMPLEVLQHKDYKTAKLAYVVYNRLFSVRCFSLAILTILPYFEVPDWCDGSRERPCGDPDKYLLSRVKYINPSLSLILEILCILPLTISMFIQRYYQFQTFWHYWSNYLKVIVIFFYALRIFALVAGWPWIFLYEGKMAAMYLHILTPIVFSRSLRSSFRMVSQIVHSFLDTAVLLVCFILLSAWLANLLFHDPNFADYPTSLMNLLVMLTTANNPNVWVETYTKNRVTFVFFFMYMLVGFFFLMHLLFALIYNNYKVQLAVEVQKQAIFRQRNLRAAFDLLDIDRDGIIVQTAIALFHQIGSYRHIRDVHGCVEHVFGSLKEKTSEKIIFGDFQALCSRFLREVERNAATKLSDLEDEGARIRISCTMRLVDSLVYKCLSWAITFTSLVVALLDRNIRDGESTTTSAISLTVLTNMQYVFGWFFLADLLLKLHVRGREFWSSKLNCFDLLFIVIIFSWEVSTIWCPDHLQWLSFIIILRSIRVMVLLTHFTRWRIMADLLIRMVPVTAPILGIQYCVCSLFSVVGVHLFGGLVFVGNPVIEGTEYATSGLWVYNFNDFGAAMVTSFNLCVVNNWFVIMDGYAVATGTLWSRAYFITFWAISVNFTLNVVVAFFVGAFTTQLDKVEHHQSMAGLQSSKYKVLTRKKVGTSLFMGYSHAFSKYDLYEEIVRR